jgi:hypothetical protein
VEGKLSFKGSKSLLNFRILSTIPGQSEVWSNSKTG